MSNYHTTQVHAPYHFVPLSKWVYMPDWAHLVSHDVPFKDGVSGVLEYSLTNATPLCVGAEQKVRNNKPSLVTWARDPDGNPVIPGSSLKGMIRSVLEIASFGKFSAIDNNHFSYRNVSGNSAYLDMLKQKEVTAAWLKFDTLTGQWSLTRCDFVKVSHKDIKATFGKTIRNADNAVTKYKQWPLTKTLNINISKPKGKQKKRWAEHLNEGSVCAHMVFANKRIVAQGQPEDYEFSYCFYNKAEKPSVKSKALGSQVAKCFASHNEDQVTFLQHNPCPKHGIPVFALFDKNNTLHSLGLARMPRVQYKNSVHDLASFHQGKARDHDAFYDMSELIFGTIRDEGLSLKSRVSFTDALLQTSPEIVESNSVVLNSPKSTFLGAYLEQAGGRYQDYNDGNAELSGWKRYITRHRFKENNPASSNSTGENLAVQSQLEMLCPAGEFTGKIIFNNLKKVELGALIWAIQLGDLTQVEDVFHSLGHGKSLGAGAVQLRLKPPVLSNNNPEEVNNLSLQGYVDSFISNMEAAYPGSKSTTWQTSTQITHLQGLADLQENYDRKVVHHTLNDFKDFKNKDLSLAPATHQYGENIARTEEGNFSNAVPLSFNQGRLAQLVIPDNDKTWYDDIAQKQQSLLKKQAAEKQIQQASLISDPNDKVIAQLSLLAEQFESQLTKTQRKVAVKSFREVMKEVKTLAWQADQITAIKSVLTTVMIDEKTKLVKWLDTIND